MRPKDSCPVWREDAGKVPNGNSPTSYSTARLVDCNDAVPTFQPVQIANRAARYPDIVDQDVEPSVGCHRLADQRQPVLLVGDVDRRGGSIASSRTDISGDRFSLL